MFGIVLFYFMKYTSLLMRCLMSYSNYFLFLGDIWLLNGRFDNFWRAPSGSTSGSQCCLHSLHGIFVDLEASIITNCPGVCRIKAEILSIFAKKQLLTDTYGHFISHHAHEGMYFLKESAFLMRPSLPKPRSSIRQQGRRRSRTKP